MNRVDKHDLVKRRVAKRLRRSGLQVEAVSNTLGFDLLVDGALRIALRAAFPGLRRHRVEVNGRRYEYRYRTWHFNFHHHGKLDTRYADIFVCVATHTDDSNDETFVIPWAEVTGKTFSLHGGRTAYSGRYAAFRDRWDLIAPAARRRASLREVA